MLPLNFSRGTPITAEHLNSLVNEIRSSSLTPGMGYTLNKTASGTSLSITQSSSGGGSAATADCPFLVSDISIPNENGGQATLKLNVLCQEIALFSSGDFKCWPLGTTPAAPNFVIANIPAQEGWYAIYLQIQMDQKQDLLIQSSQKVLPKIVKLDHNAVSTSTEEMVFLAGVTLSTDSDDKIYISDISNACPIISLPALPTCPFLVEQNSPNFPQDPLMINIRSGRIAGNYPTGMDETHNYSLEVQDTSNYWYVMCVMVVTDGQIQTGENDVTFALFDTIKTSTETLTYFLIAELQTGYDTSNNRTVEYLYNYCTIPFSLVRSACPFRLTNESVGELQQIEVAFGLVSGWVPKDMPVPPATTPPLLLTIVEKSFIYCVITYDPITFAIMSGNDIEFKVFNTTKLNTDLVEHVLVGTVDWNTDTSRIRSISSICQTITPNPCALKWDTPA